MIIAKSHVGISITGQHIMLVRIKARSMKRVKLATLGKLPLAAGSYSDGLVLNKQVILEQLADLVKEKRLLRRSAAIAVNPRQAVIRPVRIPHMPEKEMRKALEFEISRYSSFSNAPFTMDYLKQGAVTEEGVSQEELLVIAIKDSVLNDLCAIVKHAGLKIKAVDIEPNAFIYLRSFAAAQGIWPALEEDWAAVELGEGKTMVAFFRKDILQFVHTIPLTFVDEPDVIGDILRELQRSLDYYHLNLKKPQTKQIYVWGAEAEKALPQFQEALPYNMTHLPLSSLAAKLKVAPETLTDEAILALGMALREVVK